MSDSLQLHGLQSARLLCPWDSPGNNTGVSCYLLLQGIVLTQGSNSHLLHWEPDSLLLNNLGSPSIYLLVLELVVWIRIQTKSKIDGCAYQVSLIYKPFFVDQTETLFCRIYVFSMSFHDLIMFHCLAVPKFIYKSITWRIFWLLPNIDSQA